MPVYDYEAMTEAGGTVRGVIDANTPKEARDKLRQKRVHVTRMTEARRGKRSGGGGAGGVGGHAEGFTLRLPKLRGAPGINDLPMIARQLATLLKAGIPLNDAITALIDQIENRALQRVFRQIKEDIASGVMTTDAFARHPQYFNSLFVNMVKAGEASGNLDAILKRLADFLQKQAKTRGKVSAALMYPIAMVVLGTLVVIFLMNFVVPKIVGSILERGIEPPLPTQILMAISAFVQAFWWAIILGGLVALGIWQAWTATQAGRMVRDTYKLRLPIFGDLFRKQSVSRFTTTFATLLKSGVPALEALKILRDIVDNALMEEVLDKVAARIVEGTDIATPLKASGVFPPVVGYMVAIGEQSGQLEDILEKISEAYDEEIDVTIQKVTSLIEPIVIVLMAGIVGFIVLAVILPLVEGFQNIG